MRRPEVGPKTNDGLDGGYRGESLFAADEKCSGVQLKLIRRDDLANPVPNPFTGRRARHFELGKEVGMPDSAMGRFRRWSYVRCHNEAHSTTGGLSVEDSMVSLLESARTQRDNVAERDLTAGVLTGI
jgi:hypothetical protein